VEYIIALKVLLSNKIIRISGFKNISGRKFWSIPLILCYGREQSLWLWRCNYFFRFVDGGTTAAASTDLSLAFPWRFSHFRVFLKILIGGFCRELKMRKIATSGRWFHRVGPNRRLNRVGPNKRLSWVRSRQWSSWVGLCWCSSWVDPNRKLSQVSSGLRSSLVDPDQRSSWGGLDWRSNWFDPDRKSTWVESRQWSSWVDLVSKYESTWLELKVKQNRLKLKEVEINWS